MKQICVPVNFLKIKDALDIKSLYVYRSNELTLTFFIQISIPCKSKTQAKLIAHF